MNLIKCTLAIGIVAGAVIAGASTITATTNTPADEAIVSAMAAPPAFLFYTKCFEPTRANISFYRAGCDESAEKSGYKHGILRPLHPNDEIPVKIPNCEVAAPPAGEPKDGTAVEAAKEEAVEVAGSDEGAPTVERYFCFGVGGR